MKYWIAIGIVAGSVTLFYSLRDSAPHGASEEPVLTKKTPLKPRTLPEKIETLESKPASALRKTEKPPIEPAPEPADTDQNSGEYDWDSHLQHQLEKAKIREDRWTEKKNLFLEQELNLSRETTEKLDGLRERVFERERELLVRKSNSESEENTIRRAIGENRKQYRREFKRVLGNEGWQSYREFYAEYFEVPNSASDSAHLPLF